MAEEQGFELNTAFMPANKVKVAKILTDQISRVMLEDGLAPKDALDEAAEKANQLLK
ncbi:Uncharacterised protein [Mycobacteroides abscessus subsp. abscessus]|nr:Uncharacterised protein [Mycobacteroides abscessus subsp. abscessus]